MLSALPSIRFGVVSPDRGISGAQFASSLIESNSRSQTAEQFGPAMGAAGDHGGGEMVRAGHVVRAMSSVSAGYGTEGSRTPTMVAVRVSRRICLPTTKGSLCRVVVQKR